MGMNKVELIDKKWGMKQEDKNGLTMIDLFCGAGVGAVGFKLAGFDIRFAIDNKKYAVDTYNRNIGNHAILGDIRKLESKDIEDVDVIEGAFPCTPFSVAGKGEGVKDKLKGDLGYHFYRIIKEKQPKAFFMENVAGLVSKKHKDFFDELIKLFEDAGYEVSWKLMNTWEYGVPQLRKRVFVVGIRKDLNKRFVFPKPIPEELRTNLKMAVGDLKEPGVETIKNHDNYYKGDYSPRYVSRNRQKQWDEPSFTIVSSARQLPLHPEPANYDIRLMDELKVAPPRRFTVRECLRIQTVPDNFEFGDDVLIAHQYERCSGIPSLIAYQLGKELARLLIED